MPSLPRRDASDPFDSSQTFPPGRGLSTQAPGGTRLAEAPPTERQLSSSRQAFPPRRSSAAKAGPERPLPRWRGAGLNDCHVLYARGPLRLTRRLSSTRRGRRVSCRAARRIPSSRRASHRTGEPRTGTADESLRCPEPEYEVPPTRRSGFFGCIRPSRLLAPSARQARPATTKDCAPWNSTPST